MLINEYSLFFKVSFYNFYVIIETYFESNQIGNQVNFNEYSTVY
jgi:hypothetical protein